MSKLLLKIRVGCFEPYIEFYVDGENLGTRVKASLGEAGFDESLPWFGTDYLIGETALGDSVRRHGAKSAILFACGCGCAGCSSVCVDVVVSDETLTLENFTTWRGVVAPIGPVVFDRSQYDAAVRQLEREIVNWQPPPPDIAVPRRVLLTPPPPKSRS